MFSYRFYFGKAFSLQTNLDKRGFGTLPTLCKIYLTPVQAKTLSVVFVIVFYDCRRTNYPHFGGNKVNQRSPRSTERG